MTATPRRLSAVVLLALLAPAAPAAPPTPAEELLRFVPGDVSLCLVVRDLRGHSAALSASPLAERLRRSPLGPALRLAPEVQQLDKADRFLEKYLRLSAAQFRDDVLGDAVVVAYRPGPPGKPKQEEGLVLIRARRADRLAALVGRLNEVLRESGELKTVERREHGGFKYFRRVERAEENFYYLRGPVLVFSGQEGMLRRALLQEDRLAAGQESPVGRELRLLGADRALASVWLNPRAFDAAQEARLARAKGAEAAFLKSFAACWKGLDGVALSASLGADLEFALAVRARPDAVPPAVRRFFDEAAGRSDVWARFPDSALLAAGARTSPAALVDLLGAFQTREDFSALRADLDRGLGAALGGKGAAEVLPHVGPDWGLCVTAPPRADKRWFPSVVFAVRVAPGGKDNAADRALLGSLEFWARLVVFAHNSQGKDTLSLKTVRLGKQEVRVLAGSRGQAAGLQPAFALCDGYLVLASSPGAVGRFAAAAPAGSPSGEVPLLRLSLRELRQYLADRRDVLVPALAEQHRLKPQDVGTRLDNLVAALKFFDRVELVQRAAPGRVTLTFRVRTALPLRKEK